jgi:hypothetical protein
MLSLGYLTNIMLIWKFLYSLSMIAYFLIKKKACNKIGTSLFWKAKKTLALIVSSVAYEPAVLLKLKNLQILKIYNFKLLILRIVILNGKVLTLHMIFISLKLIERFFECHPLNLQVWSTSLNGDGYFCLFTDDQLNCGCKGWQVVEVLGLEKTCTLKIYQCTLV